MYSINAFIHSFSHGMKNTSKNTVVWFKPLPSPNYAYLFVKYSPCWWACELLHSQTFNICYNGMIFHTLTNKNCVNQHFYELLEKWTYVNNVGPALFFQCVDVLCVLLSVLKTCMWALNVVVCLSVLAM